MRKSNFKSLNFKQIRRLIFQNPILIQEFEDQLTNRQLKYIVRKNPKTVLHMRNPKQSLIKIFLQDHLPHSNTLEFLNINKLCYENQKRLLRLDPFSLRCLKHQRQKLCWIALNVNWRVIQDIRNPTLNMCFYSYECFEELTSSIISPEEDFFTSPYTRYWSRQQKRIVRTKNQLNIF